MATDGSSLLNVDYSLTCEEVYLRFAQAFITQHKSLDIICFATIHKAISGSSLPSWVPDWHWRNAYHVTPLIVSQSHNDQIGNPRSPRYVGDGPYVHFSASKGKSAVYKFNHSQPLVQGVVVDTVDGISASKGAPMKTFHLPVFLTLRFWKAYVKLWPWIARIGFYGTLCLSRNSSTTLYACVYHF